MAKVEAELDAAGLLKTAENPTPRQFTYADIGKLHYLDCCIKVRACIITQAGACSGPGAGFCSLTNLQPLRIPQACVLLCLHAIIIGFLLTLAYPSKGRPCRSVPGQE